MVLQLFRLGGKFPTYEQMKEQAYKAIVNGAHGLLWWGFVYSVDMEGETYQFHDAQAYPDFRRISREVMALEPTLVSPARPELLASVSDSRLEFLVKSHSKQIIVFASNFGETPISRVSFTLASAVPQCPHRPRSIAKTAYSNFKITHSPTLLDRTSATFTSSNCSSIPSGNSHSSVRVRGLRCSHGRTGHWRASRQRFGGGDLAAVTNSPRHRHMVQRVTLRRITQRLARRCCCLWP